MWIGFLLAITLIPISANADEMILQSFHGISVFLDRTKVSTIRATIDRIELLDNYDYWRDGHGLRRDATETEFRSRPCSYALAFALYGGIAPLLHGEASVFNGTPIHVVAEFIDNDAYGHKIVRRMFTFTYDARLNSRIDWAGFDALALSQVAPDFRYTPWFSRNLRSEQPSRR